MNKKWAGLFIAWVCLILFRGYSNTSRAQEPEEKKFKVLVVMSYDDQLEWQKEIQRGVESVLSKSCDLRFFNLNSRYDFENAKSKAQEAFQLYQEFQPDGVIASDDNAQTLFVIPYLRNKTDKPVVFCGVNADPAAYEYPAKNVTGILERVHFKESIALLQLIDPSVKKITFVMGDNNTATAFMDQAKTEQKEYTAEILDIKKIKTLEEGLEYIQRVSPQTDAFFIENINGVKTAAGETPKEKDMVQQLVAQCRKPTFAPNEYTIKNGVLCGVTKTGIEQGGTAGEMLLRAMKGAPISEIPIIQNHDGQAIINVTTLKDLGLKPPSSVLRMSKLVRTE